MDFVIAATPRTGSYLLCDGLDDTGVAGVPTEVFNPSATYDLRKSWSVDTDASLEEYLAAARKHGTTSNHVFGFKILWSQILYFEELADSPGAGPDILDRFFPDAKFINIIEARPDRPGDFSLPRSEHEGMVEDSRRQRRSSPSAVS